MPDSGRVAETWLLTGDRGHAAEQVGAAVGIDRLVHDLLPDGKATAIHDLGADANAVYVGDGVNDAAALATATIGVSFGHGGAALAVDAADVALIDDDLHHVADLVHLARRTRRIVRANLCFAVAVIVALVAVDLVGRLPLVLGVMGHEGSSVLVALNGLRLLRWRPPARPADADHPNDQDTAVDPDPSRAHRRWSTVGADAAVLDGAVGPSGHDGDRRRPCQGGDTRGARARPVAREGPPRSRPGSGVTATARSVRPRPRWRAWPGRPEGARSTDRPAD